MWPLFRRKRETLLPWKKSAEFLSDSYTSVFNSKCSSHATLVEKGKCRDWQNEDPQPTVGEGQVQYLIRNLNVPKSVGPDEIYLWLLRELADEAVKSLSITVEKIMAVR